MNPAPDFCPVTLEDEIGRYFFGFANANLVWSATERLRVPGLLACSASSCAAVKRCPFAAAPIFRAGLGLNKKTAKIAQRRALTFALNVTS
jgi:hypothetical protein